MTTGEPLIVRGAMKPLPTLTKPLRSVDTATHEPAQALRERTDSCTVPAAGVVGEAMVAFVLADAYRQQVRRRPHRRRARGGRRLRGTDRMAFVLIGFMGAGKSTAAGRARGGARSHGARQRHAAGGALRPSRRARVRAQRRAGVQGSRGAARVRAAGSVPARTRWSRSAAAASSPSASAARSSAHVVVLLDVDAERAWGAWAALGWPAGAPERPLARDREAFLALYAERRRCMRSSPTHICRSRSATAARALGALRALSAAPAGTRLLWAQRASGDYPVLIGRGLLRAGATEREGGAWRRSGRWTARASRPFCVSDETVASLYGEHWASCSALVAHPARRAAQDARERRARVGASSWPPG